MDLCYTVYQRSGLVNSRYKCCVRKERTDYEIAVWYNGWMLNFEGCEVELVHVERGM